MHKRGSASRGSGGPETGRAQEGGAGEERRRETKRA